MARGVILNDVLRCVRASRFHDADELSPHGRGLFSRAAEVTHRHQGRYPSANPFCRRRTAQADAPRSTRRRAPRMIFGSRRALRPGEPGSERRWASLNGHVRLAPSCGGRGRCRGAASFARVRRSVRRLRASPRVPAPGWRERPDQRPEVHPHRFWFQSKRGSTQTALVLVAPSPSRGLRTRDMSRYEARREGGHMGPWRGGRLLLVAISLARFGGILPSPRRGPWIPAPWHHRRPKGFALSAMPCRSVG